MTAMIIHWWRSCSGGDSPTLFSAVCLIVHLGILSLPSSQHCQILGQFLLSIGLRGAAMRTLQFPVAHDFQELHTEYVEALPAQRQATGIRQHLPASAAANTYEGSPSVGTCPYIGMPESPHTKAKWRGTSAAFLHWSAWRVGCVLRSPFSQRLSMTATPGVRKASGSHAAEPRSASAGLATRGDISCSPPPSVHTGEKDAHHSRLKHYSSPLHG